MKIKEFIEGRNVSYQTVRKYIVQHPDKFKGHVGRPKNIVLDDVAVRILDEKYPYPQPVEIVQDTAAREQLQELQAKVIAALETINRLQAENAELHLLKHKQKLLEQQATDKDKEIAQIKEQLNEKKYEIEDWQRRFRAAERWMDEYKSELEIEKNKTWWDKLRGK